MNTLIFIVCTIVGLSLIVCLIEWSSHLKMTMEFASNCGWGTFEKFKEQYSKISWEDFQVNNLGLKFKFTFGVRSRFNHRADCKIHASIIRFNGKGMLLKPISLAKVIIFLYKEQDTLPVPNNRVEW